nr:YdbH domain-containing protein [Sphingobium boeckii]
MKGQGRIDWTANGATSSGVFSTTGTNLAAAFGPVTNLSTEIRFTDLLGLVTEPGQRATIGEINPGIPVKDGVVRYQLLPEQRVRIEGGDWPFANGHLTLDPTTLDMAATKPRNLTFRVSGLDAAAFLQSFEFQNINASGIFDGVLPMVFDEHGGRIVDGRLVVRQGGGNLAYIGEVSKENLGLWGNFAFDTLRSVDYRTLEILLSGDLAGEMITQIGFTGLSQGEGTKSNFLTRKIAALPIKFNVRIAAPFRQLVFSARSFYDPTLLIEQNLGALISAQEGGPPSSGGETPDPVVQPSESETKP